jgi:PAS domain S-box-containing protein
MPEKKMSGEFGNAPGAADGSDYPPDIVETVREPFLVLDADLRVKFANRAFYQTFKVPPGNQIGRLIYELGDGQWDIPALRKLLDELLPTDGHFDDYQVEHDFPDIGRRTMVLNARRLHDGDDKTKLILLAIEDVSERRRAELEIARQRAWFQTMLASIGDAVIATDIEALITFINPTAEKLTGWTQQQVMGKPLHEVFNIVNEETRKTVESPVTKAIRMGTIVGLANHTLLIGKDGTERAIDDSAAPMRDERNGNIIGVVMVFHDITERRRLEYLMEVSEVRYRRLFEAAHDGILILDAKHRKITDVNPFLLDLLDYPREHFLGKELWEIGMFRDKDESQAAMEELHEKGSVRFEDKPLQDRNGRRHAVEIVANVYQEDHQPVIQCNIRDISERKRFADERDAHLINEQSLRLEAEGANRAKDMFLATLSHEMRTPLNAIVGWMSILRKPSRKVEELEEGLSVIDRNINAQVQLIEDVLDVSRIVSGKVRLEMRPCDLAEVIKAGIDVVRPAAEARGVTLDVKIDPSASRTTCDSTRIQQVIWNLLSNAIKFTPKGGKVSVALSREQSDVRIQVSDNGQGMSPELLPYVFDRFRQADSSTRRKFGGLGLGLSIVKHLVEMHGGTVEAHSDGEGKGSRFTIRLPLKAVRIDESPPDEEAGEKETSGTEFATAPPLPLVRLDGLCVLVVDDEPDARRLLVKVLQEVGAIVTAAESGKEALDLLPKVKPHVLVSDLGMPEMDGYDLIWAIRSAGHSAKELPAVALTAFAHKEHQRRALLAGFQVHVAKPVDPHDLTVVIASLAGRTGTRVDSPS